MLSEAIRSSFEQAARALTGQVVLVTFRAPPMAGALGECYRSPSGAVFIDLDPSMSAQKTWEVFLHELGHCLLHVGQVPATPYNQMSSGAIRANSPSLDSELVRSILTRREIEAATMAATWEKWTAKRAENVIKPADSWPVRIAAMASYLKYWQPGE